MSDAAAAPVTVSPVTASPVTVLLVDDHAVVREGYRRLLERHGGIVVVGEAGDADTAFTLFRDLDPQVVVLDITLPGASGIATMQHMLASRTAARVLVFSMHEETIFARRALDAGAYGYVTKASAPEVLVDAVRAVAGGRKYVSPAMAQALALRNPRLDSVSPADLSARETEVLRFLAQGLSIREIADAMGLSSKTVANHQSTIKQKLGADTAVQLLKKASQLGLADDWSGYPVE